MQLTRSPSGDLQLEVLGTRGAEIDGKKIAKEDGPVEVKSGSVVQLGGANGPSFRIDTLAVTINHLEGPLAGKVQSFDEGVKQIDFGRQAEQVAYPDECKIVGKHHFFLERIGFGRYRVNLTDGLFVAINGRPASNLTTVESGSVFRLGSKGGPFELKEKGPSFSILIEGPPRDTGVNDPVPTWQRRVRQVAAGVAVVALGVLGVFWVESNNAKRERNFEKKVEFSESVTNSLMGAVYLVVEKSPGCKDEPIGTAWALDATTLATNAHLVNALEQIRDRHEGTLWLRAPHRKDLQIVGWKAHPGYQAFSDEQESIRASHIHFQDLSVIGAYDVGFLKTAGLPPPYLKIAPAPTLQKLKPHTLLAMEGYPMRDVAGKEISVEKPEPQFSRGQIKSITDVFMTSTDDQDQSLLVQHDLPATGGSSGSPIVDTSGDVVAIFNAGNVTKLPVLDADNSLGGCTQTEKFKVVPSAVDINYAQRADLLGDLLNPDAREADERIKRDKDYWERRIAQLDHYFGDDRSDFLKDTENRLKVGGTPEELAVSKGKLIPAVHRSGNLWSHPC